MILTTSARMRDIDNTAIHMMGIPSTWLMTNAAAHVARAAIDLMGDNKRAVIFCGSGNNGGDGIAAAVYLRRRGYETRVFLVGSREKMTPDTLEMEQRLLQCNGILEDFDPQDSALQSMLNETGVVIDAMFGVGLNSELRGKALDAVSLINASDSPVIAADIPSGVETDSGRILGAAVNCDVTVTFTMAKPGHYAEPGCVYRGKLIVADIGIPQELLKKAGCGVYAVTEDDAALPKRPTISHKGDYGRLLIIAGSVEYTGAPTLCARAAVRSGAGLVYLGVPSSIYEISAVKNDEAMPFPLDITANGSLARSAADLLSKKLDECSVSVIGPGLGRDPETVSLIRDLLKNLNKPAVLDADALYALSLDMSVLKGNHAPIVLTPHDGEFLRMGGDLSGGRLYAATEFAKTYNCVLVLKGHRTITAFPDGDVYINDTGNPGMAKGGSGDVLAGMIGAFICQFPMKKAVTSAVWAHGKAGDLCAAHYGECTMTPSDMIEMLRFTLR